MSAVADGRLDEPDPISTPRFVVAVAQVVAGFPHANNFIQLYPTVKE